MVFSMPMFYDWIPRCIRPWLYIVLAFCFQFSNGMYLGAMNQVVGEWAVMREDVQMCLYATLTGMALYFCVFRFPCFGGSVWFVAWRRYKARLSVCRTSNSG